MDICNIDVNSLCFGSSMQQKNGQKIVPMSMTAGRFDFDSRIKMQLGQTQDTMIHSVYGMNTPQPGTQDSNRRNMDLIPTPEMKDALNRLDEFIVNQAATNCHEFFKTPTLTKEYVRLLRPVTGKDDEHVMRIKILISNAPTTEVIVLENNRMANPGTASDLGRNCDVIAVVDTPGIWFNNTQYGVSFTARNILVRKAKATTGLSAFNLGPGIEFRNRDEDQMQNSMVE